MKTDFPELIADAPPVFHDVVLRPFEGFSERRPAFYRERLYSPTDYVEPRRVVGSSDQRYHWKTWKQYLAAEEGIDPVSRKMPAYRQALRRNPDFLLDPQGPGNSPLRFLSVIDDRVPSEDETRDEEIYIIDGHHRTVLALYLYHFNPEIPKQVRQLGPAEVRYVMRMTGWDEDLIAIQDALQQPRFQHLKISASCLRSPLQDTPRYRIELYNKAQRKTYEIEPEHMRQIRTALKDYSPWQLRWRRLVGPMVWDPLTWAEIRIAPFSV